MKSFKQALALALCSVVGVSQGQVIALPADSTAWAPARSPRLSKLARVLATGDKPNFWPIPSVFSQQETGLAFGLNSLPVWRFGKDSTTRKSNARLGGWVSQKGHTSLLHCN